MAQPAQQPLFAIVRFEKETKCFIKPVSDIKVRVAKRRKYVVEDFRPVDCSDFLKNSWYYVKWLCDENCMIDHSHTAHLKANIIELGETKTILKEQSKRRKFPSQAVMTSETSPTTDDSSEDDIKPANNKRRSLDFQSSDEEVESHRQQEKIKKGNVAKAYKSAGSSILKKKKLQTFVNSRSPLFDEQPTMPHTTGDDHGKENKKPPKPIIKTIQSVKPNSTIAAVCAGIQERIKNSRATNEQVGSSPEKLQRQVDPISNGLGDIEDQDCLNNMMQDFDASSIIPNINDRSEQSIQTHLSSGAGADGYNTKIVPENTSNNSSPNKQGNGEPADLTLNDSWDNEQVNGEFPVRNGAADDVERILPDATLNDVIENEQETINGLEDAIFNNSTQDQQRNNEPSDTNFLRRPRKKKYAPKVLFNLTAEGRKRYDVTPDNKVYLGLDIEVDKGVWDHLQLEKAPYTYLRSLAEIIWTPWYLVNRAFDLTRITVKLDRSPRKEMEDDKMQLLNEIFEDYLKKRVKADLIPKYKANVNTIMSQKIQDLRGAMVASGELKIKN